MVKIVTAPNPALSQKAKEIPTVDKSIDVLIKEMETALSLAKDPIGVGLAAPQIGKSLSIFIVRPNPKAKLRIFINPKIIEKINAKKPTKAEKEERKKLEGCLSLPNIWGNVERAEKIKLKFLDEAGKSHSRTFEGFLSTIIQHEVDHLNGVLFPKKVLEQKGTLYKSHKNKKGEDVFDEMEI